MSALLYYLVIVPISILPYPVLYFIADGLYVILYHIVGYRKKVVMENLEKAFPEKSEEERVRIARLFFSHFCDLVVESLKTFTISEQQVRQRLTCSNPEVIDKYYDQKKSVLLAGAHYANWEMEAVGIDMCTKHQAAAIYLLLSNPYFDKKMQVSRAQFGLRMVSTRAVKQFFEEAKDQLTATAFLVDQSPKHPSTSYWTTFLNQETAVSFGIEKYAKDLDYPVLYMHLNKVKRGHYVMSFEDVCPNPKNSAYGEITEQITRITERIIREQPEYWLWSHKRWKFKKPVAEMKPVVS